MEFAKTLPDDFTEQEFIEHLTSVIDLQALQTLPATQRQAIHDAVQYLADYLLLIHECEGELEFMQGAPVVPYRGPFLANVLTRPGGDTPDRAQLKTFGAGSADKYLA